MRLAKRDILLCKDIARQKGLPYKEVLKAVQAYFDSIVSSARKLPFDTPKRIYSREAFSQFPFCVNIPYIGRLGTMYSQYLRWRSKEAKNTETVARSNAKKHHMKPMVEEAAKQALAGKPVDSSFFRVRLPSGKYSTVWLVEKDNKKKAARQMIVNNK